MARVCPVNPRGLDAGGTWGVCGGSVPFGGFTTVENAEKMFETARALHDLNAFMHAAGGLPQIKEATEFVLRGGGYASTFHAVGHKDSHEWLPGREAGTWMRDALEVYQTAAEEGIVHQMGIWLAHWYAEADRVNDEVQRDPHPERWPEPDGLSDDHGFRAAQGDQERERQVRIWRENERRLKELIQADIDSGELRPEMLSYTFAATTLRHLPR
ncbi:MAG: hypothetical protein M3P18_09900 [Actinomycetota bacterium]|nr:hypothetical protein [Actinomycetota bacterium]